MKHSEAEQRAVRAGAIPQTMRAAAIDRFGGPEVLTIREVPVPQPSAQEVLIALDTAGVGGWDASFRDGSSRSESKRMPRTCPMAWTCCMPVPSLPSPSLPSRESTTLSRSSAAKR